MIATKLFTKWVEIVFTKKATGSLVANFLRANIICCFGIPNRIICDNDIPFLNKDLHRLTEWYSITHTTLTPYYPKGNGQIEAFNKRLLKILGKMTKKNGKGWKEELPIALWAHRIAKSQATGASPFSLVYGIEAVIPIDLVKPVVMLIEIVGIPRKELLEILGEKRDNVTIHNRLYQKNMKARHESLVEEKKFQVEKLVWKMVPHVRGVAGASKYKLSSK